MGRDLQFIFGSDRTKFDNYKNDYTEEDFEWEDEYSFYKSLGRHNNYLPYEKVYTYDELIEEIKNLTLKIKKYDDDPNDENSEILDAIWTLTNIARTMYDKYVLVSYN